MPMRQYFGKNLPKYCHIRTIKKPRELLTLIIKL